VPDLPRRPQPGERAGLGGCGGELHVVGEDYVLRPSLAREDDRRLPAPFVPPEEGKLGSVEEVGELHRVEVGHFDAVHL